ncbi:MAG: hypothetical protein A2360_04240 [Candidatus Staskawiczbacteria bacterium RIFOXYB1_FULL_32_11]|uniref:Transport permease protein n=1 Tax=Candidatus Staskawiczbacteria bacterium RIFOXYD1_FULL_32_13 TaxID=1802234 RepID=A0A1G2JNZ7_9BACT|nr:MAG: Polysaccharide ABC transporter, permease protein [Parcubacteria group bacterium GW2011_GWC2_32_10]OGZ78476.1 MAG: hypothetical protein A2360_04240 [Candidatus Staskawiczbacteria bacterium RIFOXYB1_FULL_32_11]OGZ85861.1 MAG: hypothetical protein A2463_03205 [Candidatus Staskawiczbacteria bacterium RIFOXYC2_FULL_32_10]OGZ88010.1 MAG: hypothetical protein A2561_02890 [Candidatus Staskawiczbacteria bacterium RIFOXYD1_FULL_32_13]
MRKLKKYYKKIKRILELSFSLAKANFKLRNENSYLGIFWYLLEPLCFFAIILLIGGVINQNPIEYYPLYLFLGLIMFNFFINSTLNITNIIISNGALIKSMKINYEALVISGVMQFVFSHIIEMIIFLVLMIFLKGSFLSSFFYLPIFLLFVLFVLGIAFMLSAIGAYVSDLFNLWNVFTRLLWFLTPIFYVMPSSIIFQKISYFNPMFHLINIARSIIIYDKIPSFYVLLLMTCVCIFSFIIGLLIFKRYKGKFAEIV